MREAAANPLFLFIKEDENYIPVVPFAPLRDRVRMRSCRRQSKSPTSEGQGTDLCAAYHRAAGRDSREREAVRGRGRQRHYVQRALRRRQRCAWRAI